jgi:hypothetical protein
MKRILLFYLPIFFTPLCLAVNNYSLNDLKILAQEGSYKEFFAHAQDIRPSLRDGAWKEMVSQMASSWGRKMLEKSKIEKEDFYQIETLYSGPALKKDDVFKLIRNEVGLKYLKECLIARPSSSSSCREELKLFWENNKTDPEVAFKLSVITLGRSISPYSTWSLLEVALKSPLCEFYTKKKFVMEALWAKLEADYIETTPGGDLLKKIDHTLHPDCLPQLISEAKERLYRPLKIKDRELSFQILKSQEKMDTIHSDFFYTIYLLENPSQGELFNYSWNRIRELGRSAERREEVIKKLTSLDPLPDLIFSTLDQTKKRVVLNHFKTYFPEYLDFYVDQCISYYGGKKKFLNGNPTMHCQDFMNSNLAPLLIEDYKIKKYFEIRKI